jgi:spermidine synthase
VTRTLYVTRALDGGPVRVIERGRERRLVIDGQTQSVYFTDGDWSEALGEYWARAVLDAPAIPPRPRVLLVGLGGGTQIHLLRSHARPRLITVIERDPAVLRIAARWFGLRDAGGVEILHGEAALTLEHLRQVRRRFDFVMDDISYGVSRAEAVETAQKLSGLLAPRGVLVLNQHSRGDAGELARVLSESLAWVQVRRIVSDTTENLLVFASRRVPEQ